MGPGKVTGRYVASIDQGTASSRCFVFDDRSRIVSVAQHEHRQHFPRPGIPEVGPRIIKTLLYIEYLQARVRGVKVGYMQRIPMSKTGRVQSCSIIIQRHGAIYNFIFAIIVYIGDT